MFDLTSHWQLAAPADEVWRLVADVAAWPRWWPGIEVTTVVRDPGRDGVGQRTHLVVRSPLGYALRFGVEVTGAQPPDWAAARVVGDLVGTGAWTVRPADGGTLATIAWRVDPTRGWLRRLSGPLTAPLTWAHGVVMTAGESALTARLGAVR